MLEKGKTFHVDEHGELHEGSDEEPEKAAVLFIRLLLRYMEAGLKQANTNTLLAAKTTQVHGRFV